MARLDLCALAVGSLVILGSVALWGLVYRLSPELSVAARSADEAVSAGTRTTHWRSMLDAIGERPWFGYGWNQVVVAQSAVAHRHPATHEIIEHSHNVVLDLMVWNGIPLGLVLAGAMAWWSWLVARRARTAAAVLAIAPVLAVLVHGLLEFPLEYAYFLLPLGLLCGAITAEVMPSASFSLHKSLTPVLLVLAAGSTALVAGEYFRIETDLQALRYELARVGLDKPRHQYSKVTWLTQLGGFLRFAQTPERQGMSEEELAWMGRVATRYPYWFGVVRYSAALALNDHPASAQQALSKICKTHPEAVCRNAQELWLALGKAQPKIRSVAWPAN